ncbi:hypothetical protein GE09DRAFT_1145295 [Coniochaeta sp. 2T2.1]|nr:hypothetical protein GE09DRAFT_1145295 [Coniochaeta sp. 2T2.1]
MRLLLLLLLLLYVVVPGGLEGRYERLRQVWRQSGDCSGHLVGTLRLLCNHLSLDDKAVFDGWSSSTSRMVGG